ncbi:hypothetical protein MCOR27_003647 [Pyricularia oryzae]|uniref:EB domain-containing protein n=2 Tax=Pyricularia TaxID=48558 RepID=A0ABQ8N226_PYRGI|nr:hypothetical protein MCOR01_010136 [Pyricularia oryzae]KAI6289931.1 hypothetical protein MCOR33_011634 [Pyricularia grisea]KAH9436526.1 hypothetical protein MCOR02_000200 [Pyricularia oryzae]KAI6258349.1 hypothetical protein MCOR19_005298 [Pyricularia oryzae]KAI6272281.1 hypothetical protein MCOR26_007431 [Pyricularia oryzae]
MSRFIQVIVAASIARGFVTAAATAPKCNADNCARAVTGTALVAKPSIGVRMADCSAAVEVTTTPAAETTTVTATTVTVPPAEETGPVVVTKRAISTLPTYASACTNLARFSSACACWSAVSTRTVEAPTPTVTITMTATVTETPKPTPNCDSQTCLNYNPATCGNNGCYCFQVDGKPRSVCSTPVEDNCSGRPACNLSSECAKGEVCITNSCCGSNGVQGKTGVCAVFTSSVCPNPSVPTKLFRRLPRIQARQSKEELFNNGGCVDFACSNATD